MLSVSGDLNLSDGSGRSLQLLAFSIQFVDQYQLFGGLHQFYIGRLPRTGENSTVSFPRSDVLHQKITQNRQNQRN